MSSTNFAHGLRREAAAQAADPETEAHIRQFVRGKIGFTIGELTSVLFCFLTFLLLSFE